MKIHGRSLVEIPKFKDVQVGEVFCLYSDITRSMDRVLMRCGAKAEKMAVSLENGIMHSLDESEPVLILDAYLQITNKGKGDNNE